MTARAESTYFPYSRESGSNVLEALKQAMSPEVLANTAAEIIIECSNAFSKVDPRNTKNLQKLEIAARIAMIALTGAQIAGEVAPAVRAMQIINGAPTKVISEGLPTDIAFGDGRVITHTGQTTAIPIPRAGEFPAERVAPWTMPRATTLPRTADMPMRPDGEQRTQDGVVLQPTKDMESGIRHEGLRTPRSRTERMPSEWRPYIIQEGDTILGLLLKFKLVDRIYKADGSLTDEAIKACIEIFEMNIRQGAQNPQNTNDSYTPNYLQRADYQTGVWNMDTVQEIIRQLKTGETNSEDVPDELIAQAQRYLHVGDSVLVPVKGLDRSGKVKRDFRFRPIHEKKGPKTPSTTDFTAI